MKQRNLLRAADLHAPWIRRPLLLRHVDQYLELTATMRGRARTWAPTAAAMATPEVQRQRAVSLLPEIPLVGSA